MLKEAWQLTTFAVRSVSKRGSLLGHYIYWLTDPCTDKSLIYFLCLADFNKRAQIV